ncbi:hypothetical protein CQA66_08915, partial [Helicobacter aurati]
ISQADANFLFNNIETSKVALLDSEEMKETKGEFLFGLFTAIGISLIGWGMSCIGRCDKYPQDFYYEGNVNF